MPRIAFGSGTLAARAVDSNSAVVGTPAKFGILQNASVDISASTKELFGGSMFPVAVARGTAKITGKASSADINIRQYNDLFFGGTLVTGKQRQLAIDEPNTVPAAAGPYTVTVTGASSFKKDYGVAYAATGVQFIRVASGSEAAGAYSVDEASGIYTFAAADASAAVRITYEYEPTVADGTTLTITNQLLGTAPIFQVNLAALYAGRMFVLTLEACVSTKFSLATKLEDFMIPDFEFSAFANDAGIVGYMSARG
jgi:hypothetical protein